MKAFFGFRGLKETPDRVYYTSGDIKWKHSSTEQNSTTFSLTFWDQRELVEVIKVCKLFTK